jgi:hypothetical protein
MGLTLVKSWILCRVLTGVLSSSSPERDPAERRRSAGLLLHARIKSDDLVTTGVVPN